MRNSGQQGNQLKGPAALTSGAELRAIGGVLVGRRVVLALLAGYWFFSADTVPKWWTDIQPQVIVILVLVFFAQRLRMPMAVGQPYRKGET